MRVGVLRAGAVSLCLLLLAVAEAHAQAPPSPAAPPPPQAPQAEIGFVSPYEITKTVRSAGFEPLAPPLREGTTYVLRALDFRGILMRVVVDARTGAIRDVNRVVPGPGQYGLIEPPYGPPPPYEPEDLDASVARPGADMRAPLVAPSAASEDIQPPYLRPSVAHPAVAVPLPRPRPAALTSRKPAGDADSGAKTQTQPELNSRTNPGANSDTQGAAAPSVSSGDGPKVNSDVITAAPPVRPSAPKKAPAVEPLND